MKRILKTALKAPWLILVFGLATLAPAILWGGPLPRTSPRTIKIDPSYPFIENIKFQGGERACVIALSLGDMAPNITLTIHDSLDRLVAEDQGRRTAVIWYPPRTGEYKIGIRSASSQESSIYLAVK